MLILERDGFVFVSWLLFPCSFLTGSLFNYISTTDQSYILYNIGLIYNKDGNLLKSLKYYHQALELNSKFPQALNNIAIIYHVQGTKSIERGDIELAKNKYERATSYWNKAIYLAPNSYIEAQNWLKYNRRYKPTGELRL